MILSLDFVAQRYGVLPSQLLREGSSIDILIADAAQGYINQKQNPSAANSIDNYGLTQEQMLDMVARAKQGA
jgi:hypothetical protein